MGAYLALAGLQLVGGFQQADIIRQNGDLQAKISGMNAQFAELDAHNALTAGYSNAARYQDVVNQTSAKVKSGYASEGVTIGYGSAASADNDNKIAGLENTLQIQRQAQNSAVGYETKALNITLGGEMTQLQSNLNANAAQSAGMMQAISTGVSGYAYGQSTGKGTTSRTGTDSSPTYDKGANVGLTSDGTGMSSPVAWHARNDGGGDFFGHDGGWKPMNAQGNSYWDPNAGSGPSFTAETGG